MITDELLRLRETERLELRRSGGDILVRLERDRVAVSESIDARCLNPVTFAACLAVLRCRQNAIDEPDENIRDTAVLNRIAEYDAPDAA